MLGHNQENGAKMIRGNTTSLFVASAAFIIACIVYSYIFINSTRDEVRALNSWVDHSRGVISQILVTMNLQETMLSDQRGFLLTGDQQQLDGFLTVQKNFLESAKKLKEITKDNPEQFSRADEIEDFALQYVDYLNKRKDEYAYMMLSGSKVQIQGFMGGLETVNRLHEKLTSLVKNFLEIENSLLVKRMAAANEKREEYSRNLMLSLFGSCALIMVINWILFQEQRKYFLDSERLRNIDDRHKVAIKAANDGIFDWDIANKNIFLSSQIFQMCGYDKEDYDGSLLGLIVYMNGTNPLDLIHPEDIEAFKQNLDYFANGLTSEYNNTFRVKHANGYWIWIYARGGGVFGQDGKPVRMIGSHSDITAQKQMEERLKKDMEEVEVSSKAKMEFLAHMSHEIRTPLTTVTGIAEILARQSETLSEKQNGLIKTLVTSATTLKDLINDVLDFSRIDSGEINLEKNAIQIDSLLSEVVSIMSVQAIEKNLAFVSEHEEISQLVFEGDQVRIRQILINLVGNAIKFTAAGSVTVKSTIQNFAPDSSTAILSVKVIDTGIGISSLYHDLIFDKFKQVDDTISKGFGGTGLGLPISRSLAEMMGGTVRVESEADKGSTFILEIPVRVLNLEEFLESANKNNFADVMNVKNKINQDKKKKVLLVEDYEGNIVVISYILDELGLEYDIARNGLEAIDQLSQNKYSAILMDLQMPKMDGLSATLKIREQEKKESLPQTPIIGMTAHATFKDRNNCLESGMNAFLSKPIDQKKLVETLSQYL